MEQLFSLDDMIDMVKRRFNLIAAFVVLGAVASLFLAISQTHLYQSTEVIQVARPTIDDDLARTTADGSSARRLQLIEQQLMTRDMVLDIANQYGIFEDTPRLPLSERVALMRESVEITGIAAAREGFTDDGTVSVLSITATFDSPEKAQGVAHEFAKRTIEISANTRIEQARETLRFFTEEENKLLADLEDLEREFTVYQRENNLAIEGGIELRRTQIASINEAILDIERERISLEQELAQLDQTQRTTTLERQQREVRAQMQILDNQKNLLETRLQNLTQAIEITPEIERDLGAFDRRRDKLRGELEVIATRRAEAEVGFKIEEQRQSERLTVIEPAALPDNPITPSRKRLAIMGTVASGLLGLIVAFLLDLRRPVIRTSQQMKTRVGITPVVTIPPLEPNRKSRKRLANAKIALAGYIHEARSRQSARKDRG